MAIGTSLEYMTNLQNKVKSLTRRLEAFESGQKYLALRKEFKKRLAAQKREINKLKTVLARAHREIVMTANNWF